MLAAPSMSVGNIAENNSNDVFGPRRNSAQTFFVPRATCMRSVSLSSGSILLCVLLHPLHTRMRRPGALVRKTVRLHAAADKKQHQYGG
jgi:hypothetical protein